MGECIDLPVQPVELFNLLLSRCHFGGLSERERRAVVKKVEITAHLMLMLAPDILAVRRGRI
jgi:hypothetical protein